MSDLTDIAVAAAREAGSLLLDRFRSSHRGVATKSTPTDMVSEADKVAEALIFDLIRAARPDDAFLGEETGASGGSSGIRWVIDPLDGTTNFLYRIPHWGVSIAAEDADGVCAAAIYDPVRDELFAAARGEGATRNGEPIHVSDATDLRRSLILTGFAYKPQERLAEARILPAIVPNVRDIRRAGSATLDFAWVACGRADGYFESPTEWWDVAAGTLIVAEAGGLVGTLPPLGRPDGSGWVTAGPGIYHDLLGLVTRAMDEAG